MGMFRGIIQTLTSARQATKVLLTRQFGAPAAGCSQLLDRPHAGNYRRICAEESDWNITRMMGPIRTDFRV
jgi:hypothetical protein